MEVTSFKIRRKILTPFCLAFIILLTVSLCALFHFYDKSLYNMRNNLRVQIQELLKMKKDEKISLVLIPRTSIVIEDKITGVAQLSENIRGITRELKNILGVEIYFSIDKKLISFQSSKLVAPKGKWAFFDSTFNMQKKVGEYLWDGDKHNRQVKLNKIKFQHQVIPLKDTNNNTLGFINVLLNMNKYYLQVLMLSIILIGVSFVVCSVIVIILYIYIGRVENIIVSSHKKIREGNKSIKRYAAELKRSNEELSQFAYAASHDLHEPVRVVSSYSQLLEEELRENISEDGKQYIKYIFDATKRMHDLIAGLLSLSRVNTGAKDFALHDTCLIVKAALENLGILIKEKNAQIIQGYLPEIKCDDRQICQVFQNLINNSLKFSKDRPVIKIAAKRGDDEWIFSVQDNGIGIGPKFFDKIFVIFQRLHTRDKYSGTGIGLSICRKVVTRHGGRIWVEIPAEQQGTIFNFSIVD